MDEKKIEELEERIAPSAPGCILIKVGEGVALEQSGECLVENTTPPPTIFLESHPTRGIFQVAS